MTKNIENMYPSCTINVFYDILINNIVIIVVDVYLYIWFRIFKKRWSHRTSNTYMEILNSGKCKSCFSKVLQEMKLSRPEDNNYFHYYHCPFINELFSSPQVLHGYTLNHLTRWVLYRVNIFTPGLKLYFTVKCIPLLHRCTSYIYIYHIQSNPTLHYIKDIH